MRFNKFLKLKSSSGQVAIILILVVAISFIFYAVTLNLGKISQVKTLTTIASNQAASQLASQMASYGQQLFEVQLGGKTRVCGYTGVLAAILTIIVVIVSYIFPPTSALLTAAGATTLIVVSVANLVLQMAVVQPGITELWDDIKASTLSIGETFLENGVQTGLSGVITDKKQVPDFLDMDRDGMFGVNNVSGDPQDMINRYALYYTERLKQAAESGQATAIGNFQEALRDLLFQGTDGWGLYDPITNCTSSECNPCCVDEFLRDINGALVLDSNNNPIPLRPSICGTDNVAIEAACLANSPYPGTIALPSGYPWVYDPFLEERGNAFTSFRELIGRDDEHKDYHKKPLRPNRTQVEAPFPPLPAPPSLLQRFVVKDTEGYYVPPDKRQSIAPFFYKAADWKVDLIGPPETPFTVLPNQYDPQRYECHWCEPTAPLAETTCPADQPAEIPQLVLPNPAGLTYNITSCVDGTDANQNGNPPLAVDKVTFPSGILAADGECAQEAFSGSGLGFWKRGRDRFCSTEYPYASNCEKHKNSGSWCTVNGNAENCSCTTASDPNLWPDDVIDDIYYGISDLFQETFNIRSRNANELVSEFTIWYPDIAKWIEPLAPPPYPSTSYSGGNICFVCNPEPGTLWKGLDAIGTMASRLAVFRDDDYSGTRCDVLGTGDTNAVWCVPPAILGSNSYGLKECRSVTPAEAATFDSNHNNIRGDLEDVVACLNWNIDDSVTYADATTVKGNYEKFNKCATDCTVEHCSSLPRSLVPGLDTHVPDWGVLAPLQACLSSCNNIICQAMPNRAEFTAAGLPDPATVDFELTQCGVTWAPGQGNLWYDTIEDVLNTSLCDPRPGGWFDLILQSVPEAQVQEAKFKKRRDFLQGRLKELYGMIVPDTATNPDFTELEACFDVCSNANCQAMNSVYFTSTSPFQSCLSSCSNARCQAMPNRAEFTAAGLPDPATVDFQLTQCGATWAPGQGNLWYDTIEAVLAVDGEADPSTVDFEATQCGTWGPGNIWYDKIQKTGILTRAYDKLDKFLTCQDLKDNIIGSDVPDGEPDGPACQLIKARINFENLSTVTGLPYQAIYGWQGDPPNGRTEGYWHIVRVDARTPGKCDYACNNAGSRTNDPAWPRVRTYTKNLGLERCYELSDTEGMVKVRVTRFDEDRDPSSITFPNGIPIWDFHLFHPKRPSAYSNTIGLGATCQSAMIPDPGSGGTSFNYFNGAFLLNEHIPNNDSRGRTSNTDCWRRANNLLTGGVTSETCAQYYFHEGASSGMGIEFVQCPANF